MRMKAWKAAAAALLCLLLCATGLAQTEYPCYGTVIKNAVNVRDRASSGGEKIGRLQNGEIVKVLGEISGGSESWYEIELDGGKHGFVRGDLIKPAEPKPSETPTAVPTATAAPTATPAPTSAPKTADDAQETEGPANETIQAVATINEKKRIGQYTGELENGVPHGEGTFVSIDEDVALTYRGHWENGEISGKGYIQTEALLLHLNNTEEGQYDKVGSYYGEVYDGLPEGTGRFTTKNKHDVTWYYDGEWKAGLQHGQGSMIWEAEDGTQYVGTFENGDFMPGFVDILKRETTRENREFQLSQESIDFVEQYQTTCFAREKKSHVGYGLIQNDFNLNQFKKNPTKYDGKLLEVYGASVEQVLTWRHEGVEYEMMILQDDEGTLYYGFHNGYSDIVEDMRVRAFVLPLDYATYPNIEGTELWAVFCAITNNIEEWYDPLYPGDKGYEVLQMKLRLQELGYFTAGAALSEAYNNTCVERVEQFQLYNDLPCTGVADGETLSVLYSSQAVRRPY